MSRLRFLLTFSLLLAVALLFGSMSRGSTHAMSHGPGFNSCSNTNPVNLTPNSTAAIQSQLGVGIGLDCIKGVPYPSGDDALSSNSAQLTTFTPPDWGVAESDDVPIGAVVGSFSSVIQIGILNNPCNLTVPVPFMLYNASIDTNNTISPKPPLPGGSPAPNQLEPLGVDVSPVNGIPDGADRWPTFLNTLAARPDVPWDFNDVRARYIAINTTAIGGITLVLNFLVFEPGSPISSLYNADPRLGYPTITITQDPTSATSDQDAWSDWCAPLVASYDLVGDITGQPFRTNPAHGTHYFTTMIINQPDADLDGIENALDTCPLMPNPSWDPRGSQPSPADSDGDGLPNDAPACDPDPNNKSTCTAGTGISQTDEDCDGWQNRGDNCPNHHNSDQDDFDRDAIGDFCDPDPGTITGAITTHCNVTEVTIGSPSPSDNPVDLQPCDPHAPLANSVGGVVEVASSAASGSRATDYVGVAALGALAALLGLTRFVVRSRRR